MTSSQMDLHVPLSNCKTLGFQLHVLYQMCALVLRSEKQFCRIAGVSCSYVILEAENNET